jgi:hypothetical protein
LINGEERGSNYRQSANPAPGRYALALVLDAEFWEGQAAIEDPPFTRVRHREQRKKVSVSILLVMRSFACSLYG